MVNDILNAINNKIYETFGDEYEICNNELKQDFKEPCFFVLNLKVTNNLVIRNRYQRVYFFDIQYMPKSEKAAAQEINDVAEKLMQEMEYITVSDSLIRGTDMSYETPDNVLHFFVSYNVFMIKQLDTEPVMEILKQTQHLKGD